MIGWLHSVLQQDWLKNDAIRTHADVSKAQVVRLQLKMIRFDALFLNLSMLVSK